MFHSREDTMLTYCQYRAVSDEGRVSGRKIMRGDNEVTLTMCEACPAAQCNCGHLRFSLEKEGESSIVIRYGNGKTDMLDSGPSAIRFVKAACAAQLRPVDTRTDCASCPLRSDGFVHSVLPSPRVDVAPARAKVIPFRVASAARR